MLRVLIVDDSVVFRSALKSALDGVDDISVVGSANNGKIAIQKLLQSSVDVVTLDMEMPEMSGLETIKEIRRQKFPVKIIVFSSHTTRGSEAALEALSAGADDFLPKPVAESSSYVNVAETIRNGLLPKVLQFRVEIQSQKPAAAQVSKQKVLYSKKELFSFRPSVIVIGSSTGGPPALERVLKNIPNPIRIPILIAQHMPPIFTASLAKRLQQETKIEAAEAKNGEPLLPNKIYVAPGDFHLVLEKKGNDVFCGLNQQPQRNSVRPAVDYLFETAAEIFGAKTMGIILTGMGEDGLLGCRKIKEKSGGVMIQDKTSCVVFGMPGAVFNEELQDEMGSPEHIQQMISKMVVS